MSTVTGTSYGAGADEATIFSPEQLALIGQLVANSVATASGESASTSAGAPPSAVFGKYSLGRGPGTPGIACRRLASSSTGMLRAIDAFGRCIASRRGR